MKLLTVVGARPQFIKAAVVSKAIRELADGSIQEVLVHTGQHYDVELSEVFFRELELPPAELNLGVGSASHARQTADMLERLERVLLEVRPDRVLVYGDTNSTLAGALAGAKLQLPVAHVEAGLRCFARRMREELNRVATVRLADLLFCP
ncbi:MAG: UDP-N-acetylglucosamine 2-epimerase, partial [Gemmatimonadetes bacterium]|nr:UDP-N-acetylglucosamine 2-epimerase [Gemmatimonadota bacterium]